MQFKIYTKCGRKYASLTIGVLFCLLYDIYYIFEPFLPIPNYLP